MEQLQQNQYLYTEQQRNDALGDISKINQCDKNSLNILKQIMKPMEKPKSGEWLDSHKESGQTFKQYLSQKRNYKHMQSEKVDTKKFIYIVALEDDIDPEFQEKLKIFAQSFFQNINVKFYDVKNQNKGQLMNKWKISNRMNDDTLQYNASDILAKLKLIRPQDAYCIIGVLMSDIYPRPSWNYVFGLASLTEKVGVFSFARYNDQFWNPQSEPNRDKIIYRSCKVMVHEICHQFGIKHCIYYNCLMNGSNDMDEATRKPFLLCPICLRKLQSALSFNIRDRYENILKSSKQIGGKYFNKHVDFLDNILKTIPKIDQNKNEQIQQQQQNNIKQQQQNQQITKQKPQNRLLGQKNKLVKQQNNKNIKSHINQLNNLNQEIEKINIQQENKLDVKNTLPNNKINQPKPIFKN